MRTVCRQNTVTITNLCGQRGTVITCPGGLDSDHGASAVQAIGVDNPKVNLRSCANFHGKGNLLGDSLVHVVVALKLQRKSENRKEHDWFSEKQTYIWSQDIERERWLRECFSRCVGPQHASSCYTYQTPSPREYRSDILGYIRWVVEVECLDNSNRPAAEYVGRRCAISNLRERLITVTARSQWM
jgi:hypothetical protein